MTRAIAILSAIGPAALLIFWRLFPQYDPIWDVPILHFYVVTFFTFAAAVVAIFTGRTLSPQSPPRHRLLATAFALMGGLFFIHGITTPAAIIHQFNPGISWAAWLTMFSGGLVFTVASLDRPEKPFSLKRLRVVHMGLLLFYGLFAAVVAFVPEWLSAIDRVAAPYHQIFANIAAIGLWLWALVVLYNTWRETGDRLDGVMVLISAWMALATFSLFLFPLWSLGWWMYHFLLMAGAALAVFNLVVEYEQLKHFRLLDYSGALGLLVTALLALVASHLISQNAQDSILNEIQARSEALSRNLALEIGAELPPLANGLNQQLLTDNQMLFEDATWSARLAALDAGLLIIYDNGSTPLYVFPDVAHAAVGLGVPAAGQSSRLLATAEPLYEGSQGDAYLQTYVPIEQGEDIVGYLSLLQALPGLESSVIEARRVGLLIAGVAMGALFLAMLLILRRAEKQIASRSYELQQAYSELRAAEAMRDDLTDMIVHDLRTPLTSISLSFDLLQRTANKPEAAPLSERFLRDGRRSVVRMLDMINQMLDIKRAEANVMELDMDWLEVDQLLKQKAEQFALDVEASSKQIKLALASDLPALRADATVISRVLDNLISNSLKYTSSDGTITLRADRQANELLIQVTDDGEGMPAEAQAHIFDKYYQARDADGRPLRRGKGLGLTFCKMAVEAHGGCIRVASTPGQGTTFAFTLPLPAPVAA
ncbi:MAG: HAMP domain-containing histidine kinase [Anaerolineales bacterium]|nr:HAMP domain-containing histidine kinase [Anaerolineales bacterium]